MEPIVPATTTTAALDFVIVAAVGGTGAIAILCLAWYLVVRGNSLASLWTGLILGFRGLLAKELRSRSRGWRPPVVLTFYLGMLSLAVAGFLAVVFQASGTVQPITGPLLFSTLAIGSVLLLAFITPALTTGAISGERERRTLELLLVGRASALGLVGGKLLGSVFYILYLLVAALPIFSVVYLFGGVPPLYLGMVLAVAAVTAITHAALGLLLSAILRRTIVASAVAYLLVLGLVFGIPFVSAITVIARQGLAGGMPPIYVYMSPLFSLSSVLPSGRLGVGSPGMGDLFGLLLFNFSSVPIEMSATNLPITQTMYVLGADPVNGQPRTVITWAPWVYHFVLSGAFILLSLLWSALAIAPVKPWQAWRLRRQSRATSLKAAPGGEPA